MMHFINVTKIVQFPNMVLVLEKKIDYNSPTCLDLNYQQKLIYVYQIEHAYIHNVIEIPFQILNLRGASL